MKRKNSGIVLVECLVYCGLLFLVLGLAFALFDLCWENSRNLRQNAEGVTRALTTGERWREDVRHATGPLRLEQTADGQVLHIPAGGGEVLYRASQETIWRQTPQCALWIEMLGHVKSSEMQPDRRTTVTAWRWDLELKNRDKNPRHRLLLAFESVPPPTDHP